MIQAHELIKVTVNRSYHHGDLANFYADQAAVYEFAYEYDNGVVTIEELVIPFMSGSHDGIDKLGLIKDFLIEEFVEVETPVPFEDKKIYVRKAAK